MSDKYEEAADKWHKLTEGIDGVLLKDAFRWYDELRENETCEWRWEKIEGQSMKMGFLSPSGPAVYCMYCGGSIVEKEK